MVKKIKVQSKFTSFAATIFSMLSIFAACCIVFYLVITKDLGTIFVFKALCVVAFLMVIIPVFFSSTATKEIVTDMTLTPETLSLVYKFKRQKRIETIQLKDIEGVFADIEANQSDPSQTSTIESTTTVSIFKKGGEVVSFTESPNGSFTLCKYAFVLRLLAVSEYLPNFKYRVTGNSEYAKNDINFYAENKNNLSLIRKMNFFAQTSPFFAKIMLFVSFSPVLILLLAIAYLLIDTFG